MSLKDTSPFAIRHSMRAGGYDLVKPMLNEGTTKRLDIESGNGRGNLLR